MALGHSVDVEARASIFAGMAGAVLLDLDKPCIYFFGMNPFPRRVTALHGRVQNESPDGMRNEFGFGLVCAGLDAIVMMADGRRP